MKIKLLEEISMEMSYEELKNKSCCSGEVEVLTDDEIQERLEALKEMEVSSWL